MSVSAKTMLRSPLAVGACITAVVTITGTAYALINPRPGSTASWLRFSEQPRCKTVVFDPQPPLNVRSTPVEKQGNIVGGILNWQEVTIVAEKEGWVQISAPVKGWIYQNLTKTLCDPPQEINALKRSNASELTASDDMGSKMLQQASVHFQAGNLPGAIAIAKGVPQESPAYDQAQIAIRMMPRTWNQAKSKYETAEEALEDRRWSDVLTIVTEFPDIRYWRQKLAPVVKKAILMQHFLGDQ